MKTIGDIHLTVLTGVFGSKYTKNVENNVYPEIKR